jgi:DNA-binding LytR/AlgR family response regulator
MNILIADDERPARAELRYMLEPLVANATIYEARHGQEALDQIIAHPIDVVFLDINMPGVDGLTVAQVISEKPDKSPLIVFATAYDAHALRAFDLAALDYLVKPFEEKRLAQTLVRVREALQQQDAQENVRAFLRERRPKLTKLWAEREDKSARLVDFDEIAWISAESRQTLLHTPNETFSLRQTLKELAERLPSDQFARIHKAYIVNLNQITAIDPFASGTYIVTLRNDRKLPMSRQYGRTLRTRFA